MRRSSGRPLWLLAAVALSWVPQAAEAKASKKLPPIAVEARFKERITTKLERALASAASHLAWALGVAEGDGTPPTPGVMGDFAPGYELDLDLGTGAGQWRSRCEADIDPESDSPTHCAIHKLQALTALCEVPGAAEAHRAGVLRLLRRLLGGKRGVIVAGLGAKRALLPVGNGMEAWMTETPPGSGTFDIAVPVHAAAMLAVVQCGSALGEREMLRETGSWFAALEKAYPRNMWQHHTFHLNAILWESFTMIAAKVRGDSSFAEDIEDYAKDMESYLDASFNADPRLWSFSAAHATSLTWATAKKSARRRKLGEKIDEYLRRWVEIAPSFNVTLAYTCGPLQGWAPLLAKQGDDASTHVSQLLKLAEKDTDLFQIVANGGNGSGSIAAQRLGPEVLDAHWRELEGAFFRDEGQLRSGKRFSVRIDDTAQCVKALARTLVLLEGLVGVDVGGQAEAAGGEAEGVGEGAGAAGGAAREAQRDPEL